MWAFHKSRPARLVFALHMQELLEVKLRLKDLVLYFLQKVRSFVCVRFLDDRMSLDRLRREQGFIFVIFDVFLKNGRSQPAEGL